MAIRSLGVIPARYASTRFPGKPLTEIQGKSMIQRVYERASLASSLSDLIVATDDDRIFNHIQSFGGKVMLTSSSHRSGTERLGEVIRKLEENGELSYDVVLNIQGDEPMLDPGQVDTVVSCFENPGVDISTLKIPITRADDLINPNVVKVVTDYQGNALYFSRSAIPYLRDAVPGEWHLRGFFFKHVGLYAFRLNVLKQITLLPPTSLEVAESLEQLRWLEHGLRIKVEETEKETIAVDTVEDLLKFTNKLD